jgi:hypothetical protein
VPSQRDGGLNGAQRLNVEAEAPPEADQPQAEIERLEPFCSVFVALTFT